MTLRFYFDGDASEHALVEGLRKAGFDCLTSTEAGAEGVSDEEHLRLAVRIGRVLVSSNVGDYMRLHSAWLAQGAPHAGMVGRSRG